MLYFSYKLSYSSAKNTYILTIPGLDNRMITSQPCSILLIEDNIADADLIQRVLKKNDPTTQIYLSRDGEDALNQLDMWVGNFPNPLLILLDLKLPKIDGLDVLKTIKTDVRFHTLPVVVLTSSNQIQDIQQAYYLGTNSYILKAIDFDEFSKAVEMIQHYWCRLNVYPF